MIGFVNGVITTGVVTPAKLVDPQQMWPIHPEGHGPTVENNDMTM
jgi:hypothetical protein